jgi:hypothetical protein
MLSPSWFVSFDRPQKFHVLDKNRSYCRRGGGGATRHSLNTVLNSCFLGHHVPVVDLVALGKLSSLVRVSLPNSPIIRIATVMPALGQADKIIRARMRDVKSELRRPGCVNRLR